jgi:hypothetical protein
MSGIIIQYEYSGDIDPWKEAVQNFIGNIQKDQLLQGKFSYVVANTTGNKKIHIARWVNEETLAYLQAQSFFKKFAIQVKKFAGSSLQTTKFEPFVESAVS